MARVYWHVRAIPLGTWRDLITLTRFITRHFVTGVTTAALPGRATCLPFPLLPSPFCYYPPACYQIGLLAVVASTVLDCHNAHPTCLRPRLPLLPCTLLPLITVPGPLPRTFYPPNYVLPVRFEPF